MIGFEGILYERRINMMNISRITEGIKKHIVAIVVAVIATIIGGLILNKLSEIQSDLKKANELSGRVEAIEKNNSSEEIKDANERIDKVYSDINDISRNIGEITSDVREMKDKISSVATWTLTPTSASISSLGVVYSSIKDDYVLYDPKWTSSQVIGIDPLTSIEYTAGELYGENLLFPYTENGKDILFYGKFNEKNHWDGNCIINVFSNKKLEIIMDAEYSDGVLLSYKQVLPHTTHSGQKVWIVSNRYCDGNENIGNSIRYYREKEYIQNFEIQSATSDDLISIDLFEATLNKKIEGFYHGKTSDGKYNDSTGDAYYISFGKDGTVNTLYVGRFRNGNFDDTTYDAWEISKKENGEYLYFKGKFINGDAIDEKISKKINPISIKEIYDIVLEYPFECELNWYGDNNM